MDPCGVYIIRAYVLFHIPGRFGKSKNYGTPTYFSDYHMFQVYNCRQYVGQNRKRLAVSTINSIKRLAAGYIAPVRALANIVGTRACSPIFENIPFK